MNIIKNVFAATVITLAATTTAVAGPAVEYITGGLAEGQKVEFVVTTNSEGQKVEYTIITYPNDETITVLSDSTR